MGKYLRHTSPIIISDIYTKTRLCVIGPAVVECWALTYTWLCVIGPAMVNVARRGWYNTVHGKIKHGHPAEKTQCDGWMCVWAWFYNLARIAFGWLLDCCVSAQESDIGAYAGRTAV